MTLADGSVRRWTSPSFGKDRSAWRRFREGQLPKFYDNLYRDAEEDYWMVPTAEVPLTGIHIDDILDADRLPLR